MSVASNILRNLTRLDKRSRDFVSIVSRLLHAEDYPNFSRKLDETEALSLIDFLDQSLDVISRKPEPDLYHKCFRALRKLCAERGILPSSCVLSEGLSTTSDEAVAQGGFANVWRGVYRKRPVAIKVFRLYTAGGQAEMRKKFCKEAVVWKKISHPNVVPFLGISTTLFPLCIVLEWMSNGDITRYVKSHPEVNRVKLLVDVVNGLDYLHFNEVIHGDLKGPNILINDKGQACLSDFGLSSITRDPKSINASTGGAFGSSRWAPPELFSADVADIRPSKGGDMYALAMVAIEVFTGKVPFPQYRKEVVMFKVMKGGRPPRPEDCAELGLSDNIWRTMEDCWQTDPSLRPTVSAVRLTWSAEMNISSVTLTSARASSLSLHESPDTPLLTTEESVDLDVFDANASRISSHHSYRGRKRSKTMKFLSKLTCGLFGQALADGMDG